MTAPSQDQVLSFGCRVNIGESEAIRQLLARTPADGPRIVVNGCAVTASAMADARRALRQARRAHPEAQIIATGCAAQVDPAMFAEMPEVDRVLGNREKLTPDGYADGAERLRISNIRALARTAPQLMGAFDGHARAFLEVQSGCDHSCTFCIIPMGRGHAASSPVDEVIAAAERLVAAGHCELVLSGVDVTSWGQDLPGAPQLGDLVGRLLDQVPGVARLRLGSLDVAELDDALFDRLTGDPRMMPHVHLSLQHGDDLILKRMKRRHSRAQAVRMVERLKTARPEIAIGADLIAGFPTEDDAAHDRNGALIADCDIVFGHIFPYSPREGTPAARMPACPPGVGKARAAELRRTTQERRQRWLMRLVGQHTTMLVERSGLTGHSDAFAPVTLTRPAMPLSIQPITIIAAEADRLIAEPI